MESREIIRRVIEFDNPPRIGMSFNEPNFTDICLVEAARLCHSNYQKYSKWGFYEDEQKLLPSFKGETRRDAFGNIYGRLSQKTKGECLKGALQDGWEYLDNYEMPAVDHSYEGELAESIGKNRQKFIVGVIPVSVFSTARDIRRMDNLLMDLITEKDAVRKFLGMIEGLILELVRKAAESRLDGIFICDDWGTQSSLLINPQIWRDLFKPIYANIAAEAHKGRMKFMVHSCGYIYDIIEDFIEAGVDVLQLDQPGLLGVDKLGDSFGGRMTFWSPVDIQKTLATGDRTVIESEAARMVKCLGSKGGGYIAKDYPALDDINVKDQWAQWARDVFTGLGAY